jgi:hypothetical protein
MLACSCSKRQAEDDVPIIGLGNDGQTVLRYMPRSVMMKHLSPMLGKTVDLTSEKLQKYEGRPTFHLSRVSIGLEVDPSIGIDAGIIKATVGLVACVQLRLVPLPLPGEPINSDF